MNERIADVKKKFVELYGGQTEDLRVFAAPGRVNLIGEHIDYCGGYVFPAALTLDTMIIARPRKDRIIRMAATDLADRVEISLDHLEDARHLHWGSYQAGVADELQKAGYTLTGADMLFDGTIPYGAGLSSSASIEVATAVCLVTLGNEKQGSQAPIDLVQMAVIGQRAENNFCDVSCGIMDQFASAMGKENHAILLDCGTLHYKHVPLTLAGCKIVIANTNKKRSLGESKYNERTREVAEGLEIMRQYISGLKHLCSMTVEQFETYKDKISNDIIRRRVEHVVYENHRVLKSVEALENGNLSGFGSLLAQAHASIRDLYEVTGFELDTMVEEALKAEGVIGARMTGAGFGGCTVNIVKEDCVENFILAVGKGYHKKTGLTPAFYVCEVGAGAREVKGV